VPDENIDKNFADLCIRRSNLKHLNHKILEANLKKTGHPNFLAG
jgi:hypothetical protein